MQITLDRLSPILVPNDCYSLPTRLIFRYYLPLKNPFFSRFDTWFFWYFLIQDNSAHFPQILYAIFVLYVRCTYFYMTEDSENIYFLRTEKLHLTFCPTVIHGYNQTSVK